LERGSETENDIPPWYIHWLLISESLGGWTDYMTWLEKQLDDQVSLRFKRNSA